MDGVVLDCECRGNAIADDLTPTFPYAQVETIIAVTLVEMSDGFDLLVADLDKVGRLLPRKIDTAS
jgi:hypothetical protein